MKKSIYFLVCFSLTCISNLFAFQLDKSIIDSVSIDSLIYSVNDLSGEHPVKIDGKDTLISKRRFNTSGNQLAEKYLYNRGIELGFTTSYQVCSETCKNIIWEIDGTLYPDSIIIIGAHFDSDCFEDGSGQTKYLSPGANDNASGCAAIIEIARLLRNYKPQFKIKFIFWDEEEFGMAGSAYYSNLANSNFEKIKLYINLDMLGWDKDNDGLVRIKYVDVAQSLNYASEAINICKLYNISLKPELKTIKGSYIGFTGDADYFWHNGFSAIGLADLLDDISLYHSEHDLVKYFNQEYYLNNSKFALALVLNFAYDIETDVSENYINGELSLYPNPASEYLVISGYDGDLEIINALGNNLWHETIQSEKRISVSNLVNGIYFLKTKNSIQKFMVLK
ncbi:MAG: M20/M25/M40 family metallo-hydrolase [Ignavibacteriae bacterium]|nr:M20/M25/M40 family metallo-hydrolase [Ignavibacteriota bacterium]